jgi:AraC-like DNA-binding protein
MKSNFYLPESPSIRNSVRAIFQTDGLPEYKNEAILPKGSIEIIFDLSKSNSITGRMGDGQKQERLPRCFIYGFTKTPIYVELPHQQTYFGILLHPIVIRDILGIPAQECTNRWVDLTLIDPVFSSLWHQLADETEFESRVVIITQWIEKRTMVAEKRDQLLNAFVSDSLLKTSTVPEVASTLCYSPRHLSRKVYAITGMNTEEMLHYKKYLRALDLIYHSSLPLSAIAHESHFTDQSHFIKSFRSFTDITPGEYSRLKNHTIPGHIFTNVR